MNKLTDDQIFTLAAKSHGCGLSADEIKSCDGEGSAAEFYASELLTFARSIEAATLTMNTPSVEVEREDRLRLVEDLAADAVAGMRYIEQSHGRLYGVGWDRVYKKADFLKPALVIYPEPQQ
jgi:hypothetical protein